MRRSRTSATASTGDQLGDDPLGAFERAHAAALTAVDEAPDRDVHLSFGDAPRAEYTRQLAADHLVHAWDLARALGEDDTLDAGAVEAVREWFGSMEDAYRGAGVIGDRVPVDPGADPQTVLLAMFGRARGGDALAAVERFDRAFGARDVDAVMAAMTPDCVFEDTSPPDGRRHVGAAAVRAAWEALFAASPEATFTTEEIVEAGDRVVAPLALRLRRRARARRGPVHRPGRAGRGEALVRQGLVTPHVGARTQEAGPAPGL